MEKQNLKTELMLLCDYGLISKEGKISAIGVFDEMFSFNTPLVLNKGFVVATLTGTPNTSYKISLKVEHGNKRENLMPSMEANIQTGANGKANIVIEVQGIAFPLPGSYSFRLYSDEAEIGARELKVSRVQNSTGSPIIN